MIYPVTMYSAECDNCKEDYHNEDNGWCATVDTNSILEMMGDDGWVTENGKHYCQNCFKYDDKDNFIINETRTKNSVFGNNEQEEKPNKPETKLAKEWRQLYESMFDEWEEHRKALDEIRTIALNGYISDDWDKVIEITTKQLKK
jgi:hypothetical protein